jgi:hypothetical protein
MIRRVRDLGRFWYDFIVGDDWRIAAGVALVLLVGAIMVHGRIVRVDAIAVGVPVVVVALVAGSILFDARRARDG